MSDTVLIVIFLGIFAALCIGWFVGVRIYAKKKQSEKSHKVVVKLDEVENDIRKDAEFLTSFHIHNSDFVVKKDLTYSLTKGKGLDAYGKVDGIEVKLSLTKKMFIEDTNNLKEEYIEKLNSVLFDFSNHYKLIIDRLSKKSAEFLNSKNIREQRYTEDEVKQGIDNNYLEILLSDDAFFSATVDEWSSSYTEYKNGDYKVEFNAEE